VHALPRGTSIGNQSSSLLRVHVESSPLGRARALELSSARFRRIAVASAVSLYLIVISGAAVRLTASGLGCESWPGCEPGSFFPASGHHSWVEFGNRAMALFPITLTLLAWLAAWRTPAAPGWLAWLAGATFLGTIGQAPLGLVTITSGLHPLLVMTHFLLALVVLALGVVVAVEAWSADRGRAAPLVPLPVRRGGLVLAGACAALVVTGTFSTAAGPHPGSSAEVRRIGSLVDMVWVHVRATAVFGVVLALLVAYLVARRDRAPRLLWPAGALLALVAVQMAVGEVQWRTQLPWGLVLVHVSLAAAIWAVTVFLVVVLWRPPAAMAHRRA
jgi:cytochrome c oxidase assembly protein subunit 15